MAHRLFILAATTRLTGCGNSLVVDSMNEDMEATLRCLRALGAQVSEVDGELVFDSPCVAGDTGGRAVLRVGESGSTLRFLIPVVAALGRTADFICEGRLPERPLAPLDRELLSHGTRCSWEGATLHVDGQLQSGRFVLPGDVSSQFASGLLLAAPILAARQPKEGSEPDANFELLVSKPVESLPYIDLTISALAEAGYDVQTSDATLDGMAYLRFSVVWSRGVSPRPHDPALACRGRLVERRVLACG